MYILQFKGTQFFAGLGLAIAGGVQYYCCVGDAGEHNCMRSGPGVTTPCWLALGDLMGSCVLVWIAFLLLPCSHKHGGMRRQDPAHHDETDDEADSVNSETRYNLCGCREYHGRGGRMRGLLRYDLVCFSFCFVILIALLF